MVYGTFMSRFVPRKYSVYGTSPEFSRVYPTFLVLLNLWVILFFLNQGFRPA